MPKRIQRKRTKGWRLQENTLCVSRPSRWGNPYRIGKHGDAPTCVRLFEAAYEHDAAYRAAVAAELAGKDLACWCKEGEACHGDTLLRWANDACPYCGTLGTGEPCNPFCRASE